MRVISWNVNGLRSLKGGLKYLLKELDADILCLQETKVTRSTLDEETALVEGYNSYFACPRHIGGYSGVATFCRDGCRPERAQDGLSGIPTFTEMDDCAKDDDADHGLPLARVRELDGEGRAIITVHAVRCGDDTRKLAVVNVYCPRADPDRPERGLFKLQFYKLMEHRARSLLDRDGYVLIVGDMNTAHRPIDHCDPAEKEEFESNPGRQWLNHFLKRPENGEGIFFLDTFRHFHPDRREAFTCWSNVTGARHTNYGTRIDYALTDSGFLPYVADANILPEVDGSDHCPVSVLLRCHPLPAEKCPSICTRLWPEFAGRQRKLLEFLCRRDPSVQVPETESIAARKKRRRDADGQTCISHFFSVPTVPVGLSEETTSSSDRREKAVKGDPRLDADQTCGADDLWKRMLTGPTPPPLCPTHREPCVLRVVKKKGPNLGRQFYTCARPSGRLGHPEAKCDYFEWTSKAKSNRKVT